MILQAGMVTLGIEGEEWAGQTRPGVLVTSNRERASPGGYYEETGSCRSNPMFKGHIELWLTLDWFWCRNRFTLVYDIQQEVSCYCQCLKSVVTSMWFLGSLPCVEGELALAAGVGVGLRSKMKSPPAWWKLRIPRDLNSSQVIWARGWVQFQQVH